MERRDFRAGAFAEATTERVETCGKVPRTVRTGQQKERPRIGKQRLKVEGERLEREKAGGSSESEESAADLRGCDRCDLTARPVD